MTHSQFGSIRWIVVLAFLSLTITIRLPVAQAQTFRVAHTFTGTPDGAQPFQASMLYVKGALYGTTIAGGLYNSGTIFKLDGTGRVTVLYNFTGGGDGLP